MPEDASTALPDLVCARCGARHPVAELAWRCGCGGVLDVAPFPRRPPPPGRPDGVSAAGGSLWRYAGALPVRYDPAVSLGEGLTPLVEAGGAPGVHLKLDFLMPTLSFKDRGAVVLATLAAALGVRAAMLDSSGNAGTAMAAYLARAGVGLQVLVPAATSPGKLAQMRAHGAQVHLVPGDRAATADAAVQAAGQPGVLYASHVHHPYFLHGVKTFGYEVWEQLGRRLPDTVVLPVGNGTLVLGCALAFEELLADGLADRRPAIVAVQTAGCPPLARAFDDGASVPAPVRARATVAEGIAIAGPPRGAQILAAVRAGGGAVVTVTDEQTLAARADLAGRGLFVEPTSAVCWAAVRGARGLGPPTDDSPAEQRARQLLTDRQVVLPLCGAGLKSP